MTTNKGQSTVAWWIGWIVLTILSFFIACYFWTGFIAKNVGPMDKPGVPILWVAAVFGTWVVLLVPLIIVMYSKVDKAYEDARIARESKAQLKAEDLGVKFVTVDFADRELPKHLARTLKRFPETIKRGHLVHVTLKNGQRIENVFIRDKKEIAGLYGASQMTFKAADIETLVPVSYEELPNFKTDGWLRVDL